MDVRQYADLFLSESRDHLTAYNHLVLEWEKDPAENVVPVRLIDTYMGPAPAAPTCVVGLPWASRHCTTTPLLGVKNTA